MWQTLSKLSTSLTLTHTHTSRLLSRGVKCDRRCQTISGSSYAGIQQQPTKRSNIIMSPQSHAEMPKNSTTTTTTRRRCCCHTNNKSSNNNTKPHSMQTMLLGFLFLLAIFADAAQAALRNVNLLVEPPAVRHGQSVALRCDYQLDGAPLYSIKFYRGQLEFYRYTPGEYPHTKVFQYPGIKVDESSSNATLVLIRNVSFGLSGNFSCEVTADAPLYSTATAYAQMQVVEFPEKRPQLFTEHTRYEPGDVLRANCSTPPSRPRADLRFTINNMPIITEDTQFIRTLQNLIASRLSLKIQLQAVHFGPALIGNGNNAHMTNALGPAGSLVLRCTAQIGDLYQEYKEIELGTPQKDPVPARVTLSSGSGFQNFLETYFTRSAAKRQIATNWIWYLSILLLTFYSR